MDLLSELLDQARWKNDVMFEAAFHENWGYTFPCEESGGFHVITQGACFLRYGKRLVRLEKGDVVFIIKGFHHDLVSTPRGRAVSVQTLLNKLAAAQANQEPLTTLVSVRYQVPAGVQHPFFLELPEVLLVQSSRIPIGHPIHTVVEMISREINSGFGSDLIMQRLTDILLYHVIRRWLESDDSRDAGWANVFQDEKILSCLELIHRDMRRNWTIESLARSIGLSRASLAARFKAALGLTVMEYISRLRLEKGRVLVENPHTSLAEVSEQVGYSSAFAFSKAFKRFYGHSPRSREQAVRPA